MYLIERLDLVSLVGLNINRVLTVICSIIAWLWTNCPLTSMRSPITKIHRIVHKESGFVHEILNLGTKSHLDERLEVIQRVQGEVAGGCI